MPDPTVGRMVHYTSYGTPGGEFSQECRAAVVTAVASEGIVSLCVLNPTGMFFNTSVCSGSPIEGGTWHWPERVDQPDVPEIRVDAEGTSPGQRARIGQAVADSLAEYKRRGGKI